MRKIKEFLIKKKISTVNKCYGFVNEAESLCNEVSTTKWTKKIPQKIATVCSALLIGLMPSVAYAADTSTIDGFVDFACAWLTKIGLVVMLVGGVTICSAYSVNCM